MQRTVFCLLSALAFSPGLAQACEVDHFNFVWGSDSSSHMAVRNSESCKFGFKVGSRSHMSDMSITQPPQHGTLSAVDQTHWIYHPARGYTGQDQVSVKLSGDFMGNRGTRSGDSTITWAVDVSQ